MGRTQGGDATGGAQGFHPGGEGSELPVTPTAAGSPLWPASALGCRHGVLSPNTPVGRPPRSEEALHPCGMPPPHACPQPACPRGPTFPANLRCQLAPTRGPGTLSSVTPTERCVAVAVADGHGGVNREGRVGRISDPANSRAPRARTALSLVLRTPVGTMGLTKLKPWAFLPDLQGSA